MPPAADQGGVEEADPAALDQLLPPDRGGRSIAWLSDMRIAGRPCRRAQRAAAIDSGRA